MYGSNYILRRKEFIGHLIRVFLTSLSTSSPQSAPQARVKASCVVQKEMLFGFDWSPLGERSSLYRGRAIRVGFSDGENIATHSNPY